MISEYGLARDRPGDLRIRELDNPRTQWPEDSRLKVARIFQGLKNLFRIERYKQVLRDLNAHSFKYVQFRRTKNFIEYFEEKSLISKLETNYYVYTYDLKIKFSEFQRENLRNK